ncbi:MAG TPA: GMC oxidoreductase [Solirubrobacteraceae bacterium]|nr:GMC oxidoreductase [Solirubrobacteraceae bacterium]
MTRPSRSGTPPAAASSGRAAARWAAAHRSTGWSTSAAIRPTTTDGATTTAAAAGATRISCPTSAAPDQQHGESEFHGTGGPLRVEDPRYTRPLSQAWLDAAKASGLPENADFNAARQEGAGYFQLTQRGGRRWSTADGYLRPALERANLEVKTGALVTSVVIEGGRATGVQYVQDGAEGEARAGEVVLCGGAVSTPQLLMLSGIGPGRHLREHAIAAVVDAPRVGDGLQDHPLCIAEWNTPKTPNLWEEATPESIALWQREQRGPAASNGAETAAFTRTREGLPAPDLQLGALPGPGPDEALALPDRRAVGTIVIAVDVKSRGRIALRSADPRAKPVIDPRYLAEEADLDILVAGVRKARAIAGHEPLARLTAGEHAPGGEADDDDALRAWIRRNVGTAFHPSCSCAMGGSDDAVCDPELRVRGVGGLRIADASVMPAVPRGNTNAPTIAIAERAADLIRGG